MICEPYLHIMLEQWCKGSRYGELPLRIGRIYQTSKKRHVLRSLILPNFLYELSLLAGVMKTLLTSAITFIAVYLLWHGDEKAHQYLICIVHLFRWNPTTLNFYGGEFKIFLVKKHSLITYKKFWYAWLHSTIRLTQLLKPVTKLSLV